MAVGPFEDLPPHLRNYLVRNKAVHYLQSSAALIALIGLAIHLIALIHVARDKQHALSTGRFWLTAIYMSGWIILLVLVFALLRMWLVTA